MEMAAKGKSKKKKKEDKKGGGGRREERGLMSSAGLMRYYDVEESAIKLPPRTILIFGLALGTIVLGLEIFFGVWPH